jgi:uncharacterized damage-inducible protein DinB
MNVPLDLTRDLFAHMQWADATVWRAIAAHPPALEDEKLMAYVRHFHVVQRAFLLMWTGGKIDPQELYAPVPPAAMVANARAWYESATAYLKAFDEARTAETLFMPWLAHYEEQLGRALQSPTYGESFIQLPMHTAYHRGQVNARLRELGGEPPNVDYVAWVWFSRPAAEWPHL